MEKPFLEVFPGLNIADELKELLKLVMVEKVTMTKDRSSIRVYIRSPRLIHKKNIYALEEGIAKQLFPGRPITIKILEKYRLSAQYTPEKLYDVYRDSILMELKHYGMIEYNILRRADGCWKRSLRSVAGLRLRWSFYIKRVKRKTRWTSQYS